MDKDKATPKGHDGHLGHTVSHTDTASAKGGGRLTEGVAQATTDTHDRDDTSPTHRQADVEGENAKNADYRTPSGPLNAQDPEDVAGRMGSTGPGRA